MNMLLWCNLVCRLLDKNKELTNSHCNQSIYGYYRSDQVIQNLVQEIGSGQTPESGKGQGMIPHVDEEGYPIEIGEPLTYVYDEWDFRADDYKPRWCVVREKWVPEGDQQYFADTLREHSSLMRQIRRQFEMLAPEVYRKTKHLPDGEDFDLDAVIESIIDKWAGESPTDKVQWRRNKVERDVSVVFLLDMSDRVDLP